MSGLWHGFLDDQIATHGDRPAVTDTVGADWSWSDLGAAVEEMKAHLSAAGVQRGDRVLLLAENCAAALAVLYATSKLGAAVIPFNARQTAAEIDRVIDHATPAVILMTSNVSQEARAHATRMGAKEISGVFGNLHMLARDSEPEGTGDVAVVLYTTGTTGDPKGVMLTHDNMRFGGMASANLRDMSAEDLIYGVLPITHVFGLASIVTAAAYRGAQIRFEARFSAARLYEALTEGVTLLSAVPQMHALLMQYTREQGFERLPSETLRYVSSGAAPLDPAWKRKAEAFYGVALQNGYGMTETTAGISATRHPIGDPDFSAGPPLPGVEVRIDESIEGGGDGAGEVLTRGGHVMKGYFRNPEATAKVLDRDGWLHTGDLGRIDDRGFLHILGRSKELIIHGGFNVYPPEVEAALNDHPQVIQSAVIGRVVGGDEKVMAFCQVPEGSDLTAEALRSFVAERLAGYKRPSQIILAPSLPAAPTGKILKHKLMDAFADQLT
ncbi:class I adenylate-forming enzyme family protein [Aestuariivita sp.]|jgi:acyl-CoA synthetase (AMP-forming)/AMP-acid ligase II|uniref:class I adenylate-forming enzyme family protein n=1 Tax=Aestuariivita sp. TaxID=1872407 RepID=UPI0021704216|nr:class I adenylate-forming enzyme family protein [Aestuariivita sp.]MCE8009772.1 acyl--CoA ligase [Aestuariivita sp.]